MTNSQNFWLIKEKEWLETLSTFGIGKEDGKRIIGRLGDTLLNEDVKLFGIYWRHTFGSSSSLSQLLGRLIGPCFPGFPRGVDCCLI